MTEGAANLQWASTLVDGLATAGLSEVLVTPGSRSTPLVLAAANHDELTVRSHLDERSAGFFALGHGRATGEPMAVVTTSGTATANLHPAVLEASHGRVPLVILTADRPPELIESGANQSIEQDGLYGDAVRWSRTLPEVSLEAHRLRSLAATAARAVAEATGAHPGPVHLNCPFRKPLQPELEDADPMERPVERPRQPTIHRPALTPEAADLRWLISRVESLDRGLLVVGPACLDRERAATIIDFAELVGYPILADPASGVRFHPEAGDLVCAGYDGYLHPSVERELGHPELVIRIGPQPTSATLQRYLDAAEPTQVLIDQRPAWRDARFRTDAIIAGEPASVLESAASELGGLDPTTWSKRVDRAERAYWSAVDSTIAGRYFEGAIAHAVAAVTPAGQALFAANSMPIRDLDRFAPTRSVDVATYANRGVSGIDGLTSTALGIAAARDSPVVILTGDLAFYHDMNGLEAIERFDLEATIVVVNNDGGGIFHKLPIERFDPPFTELFKTPHGRDFEAIAAHYGLGYAAVHGRTDLAEALGVVHDGGRSVIECHVDAERSHEIRSFVTGEVRREVVDELA